VAWLRKMPMYSVMLLVSAVLIVGSALGYYAYTMFSTLSLKGNLDSGGHGDVYEWHGERLLLQEVHGRQNSTCVIYGRDGAKRSVSVPRNSSQGWFNTPDFIEVAPQPGSTATMTCSRTVHVSAGEPAVARARTVNSFFFTAGVPAVATIPVLAAFAIPALRRARR
jgi:hypothetical protein